MWATQPLGLPQHFDTDDADYIAGISDMNQESLQRTRKLARIDHPVCNMTIPIEFAPDLTRLSPQRHAIA